MNNPAQPVNPMSPEFIVHLWHGQPWVRLLGRAYRDAYDRTHTLRMPRQFELDCIRHIERIQNCRARGIEPRAVPTVEELVNLKSHTNLSAAVLSRFFYYSVDITRRACHALHLPAREVREAAIRLWRKKLSKKKKKIVRTIILELPELWDTTSDIIIWKSCVSRFRTHLKVEHILNRWLQMPETSRTANLRAAALCLWRYRYRIIDTGDVIGICGIYNTLWSHSADPLMCIVLVYDNLSLTKPRIKEVTGYHTGCRLEPRNSVEKKAIQHIIQNDSFLL